jgi:hypothetical protein
MFKPNKIKPTRGKDPEDKETIDIEEWLEARITLGDQPLEHAGWERKQEEEGTDETDG